MAKYDKNAAKEQAQARQTDLTKKLNELAASIVTDPAKLKEFAQMWVNGFYQYSMRNYLLAKMQRPAFTLLSSFNAWTKRERKVNKGSKAIYILAPCTFPKTTKNEETGEEETVMTRFFRFVPVFDVADTDGKPVEVGCGSLIAKSDLSFDRIAKLAPVPVEMQGPAMANGFTDGERIVISQNGHEGNRIATLFHEWAHVSLKHAGMMNSAEILPTNIKELEAEAVSYLVCSAFGIDNQKSALYLGNWKASADEVAKSATKILSTAEKIIKEIAKNIGEVA